MSPNSMSDELAYSTMKLAMPKKLTSSEDYFDWAYSMKQILSCKNANLWFIFEGTLVSPTNALDENNKADIAAGLKFKAKDQAEYHKTNAEARSTIISCLGPAQQALVDSLTDAKGVWDKLRSNYAQNTNQQIAAYEGPTRDHFPGNRQYRHLFLQDRSDLSKARIRRCTHLRD
jgi:hypothetical protein